LYRWELEDLAEGQIAGLPAHALRALTELLNAAVIVDPAGTSALQVSLPGRCAAFLSGLAAVAW
jgi:hypothetical protein